MTASRQQSRHTPKSLRQPPTTAVRYISPHRSAHQQPINGSVKVWRYLDIERLISLLSSEELLFTRVDSLEDQFEGSITLGRLPEAAVTSSAIVQASAVSYQLSRHDRRPRSEKTSVELEVARRTQLRVPQHSYTSGRQENSGTQLPYLRRSRDA
jgi:hypothetical protein